MLLRLDTMFGKMLSLDILNNGSLVYNLKHYNVSRQNFKAIMDHTMSRYSDVVPGRLTEDYAQMNFTKYLLNHTVPGLGDVIEEGLLARAM